MIDTQLFCTALKFAAHAAANKDVRYYLKGVHFEFVGDVLTLFGTDGSRVAACALQLDPSPAIDACITIGTEDVKQILSMFKKTAGQAVFTIDRQQAIPALTVEAGSARMQVRGLDGKYPDIRRVFPPEGRTLGSMPNLDAALLAEACTALKPVTMSVKGVHALRFNSSGAAMDSVLIAPSVIADPRILSAQVLIAPTRV